MPRRVIVLDTETTGFSPDNDRIIEIAAMEVSVRTGASDTIFHRMLNPERHIPHETTRVHGIADADVAGAPTFSEIAASLASFLSGSDLVIHNSAFDSAMLNASFARAGGGPLESLNTVVVDSVTLAKDILPLLGNYSLDTILDYAAIDRSERVTHGALLDVTLLAKALPFLANEYDRWVSLIEPDCAERLDRFAATLTDLATPLLDNTIVEDTLAHDLGAVVTMARWLPKFEEYLKPICEGLVGPAGWFCKHYFARYGVAERVSYKGASDELLPGVDLSAYQMVSFVYRVAPSIDKEVQTRIEEVVSAFTTASAQPSIGCMIRAFALTKQIKSRIEARRELLRQQFLSAVREGFKTELVSVTESERRTTDYRRALADLSPSRDMGPYTKEHVRLGVGERSPERCSKLFN